MYKAIVTVAGHGFHRKDALASIRKGMKEGKMQLSLGRQCRALGRPMKQDDDRECDGSISAEPRLRRAGLPPPSRPPPLRDTTIGHWSSFPQRPASAPLPPATGTSTMERMRAQARASTSPSPRALRHLRRCRPRPWIRRPPASRALGRTQASPPQRRRTRCATSAAADLVPGSSGLLPLEPSASREPPPHRRRARCTTSAAADPAS